MGLRIILGHADDPLLPVDFVPEQGPGAEPCDCGHAVAHHRGLSGNCAVCGRSCGRKRVSRPAPKLTTGGTS